MENVIIAADENRVHVTLHLAVDSNLKQIISQVEKKIIWQVVLLCGGDQKLAAKKLGIGRTTLWRKSNENQEEDEF